MRTEKQELKSNVTHPVIQPKPVTLSTLRRGGWKTHPCYNVFLSMLFSIFRIENILPGFFPLKIILVLISGTIQDWSYGIYEIGFMNKWGSN